MEPLKNIFLLASLNLPVEPARAIGEQLAHYLKQLESKPSRTMMKDTFENVLNILEIKDLPFIRLGHKVAEEIDKEILDANNYAGVGNAYHSRHHMVEVLVSTAMLITIHNQKNPELALSKEYQSVLLTAAVSHDIGHNGLGNGTGEDRDPMLTEKQSIWLADTFFSRVFHKEFSDKTQNREAESIYENLFKTLGIFDALIRSTDIGGGENAPGTFFAECAKYHRGERHRPNVPEDMMSGKDGKNRTEFKKLVFENPHIAEMACILQDADLMPSIGMNIEWAEVQEQRMAQETPTRALPDGSVNWEGTKWFHDNLAQFKSLAGKYFEPCFEDIKQHVAQKVAAPAPM